MVWQLVVSGRRTNALQVGKFGTRSLKFGGKTPNVLVDKNANWYFDRETKIAKLQVEKNGMKNIKASLSIPKPILEGIKEEQAVVYLDENALFLAPYSKGEEYLKKILKKDGIEI
jgi:uncharacterized protein YjcR